MPSAPANPSNPLQAPIQSVKGVGPYLAKILDSREVRTVLDLIYYFPMRYVDRRQVDPIRALAPGKEKCIIGEVVGGASRTLPRSRKRIFELVVKDNTGVALLVWFHFNEKYLKKLYPPGKKLFISGECQFFGHQKQFVHPEIEEWDEESAQSGVPILPIYPLSEGLYQKTIRKIIWQALDQNLAHLKETPVSVRAEGEVKITLQEAFAFVHRPPKDANLEELNTQKSPWHQRIIYDELFYLQLGLAILRQGYKKEQGIRLDKKLGLFERAKSLLPFALTAAQERVIAEITDDLAKDEPMNRLLQGDVGCGKTLVAFLTALIACENGYQAAIMAPTEILAQQHYLNLKRLADQMDIPIGLLTRTTPKKEKAELLENLAANRLAIVIGTHALIQEGVDFAKLGYIVIDEQHRFGVMQRASLKKKGDRIPHILVMTATPIPRTMAMGVYGDLDVSVIDQLPAGRKPISTHVYYEKMRPRAYDLVRSELVKGHQAYFIYPLIEESEKVDLKNAVEMAELLKESFPEYTIGLLHGRMSSEEKDSVMADFKAKNIHILVSTTVVEVGVDVPNATVMVVEHAERFGLSQLHQLRGRVGRGGNQSYCLLIAGYAQSEETRYRLDVMAQTNDGFKIAEEDLELRGPGDYLGTRQSGLPPFRLANIARDTKLLQAARKRAFEIIAEDPSLNRGEHRVLKEILEQRWEGKLALANIS